MRIVRDQESELDGHMDLRVEAVHVDFPHASGRIEARDETALLGETIAARSIPGDREFPRPNSSPSRGSR